MADRINPVSETFSPISKAQWEYEQARNEISRDLPTVAAVTDKLDALFRLRMAMLESRLERETSERGIIIKVGVVVAAFAVLFPPFHWGARGGTFGLGHSFILTPPLIGKNASTYGAIDGVGLMAILAGITLFTWAATLVKWRK